MRFIVALVVSLLSFTPHSWALQYHGADFSSLANVEKSGLVYKDSSSPSGSKFETILHNHGVNLARIRVWTSTNDADYSLNYGLALAKRAAAAGMQIYVDLHYSDTWADPGHQAIPSSWPTDLASLNTQIYAYTLNLVKAFSAQGTPIQFIEIGNEINNGILWPTGEISANGYSPLSQLLHSASSAVRAGSPNTKVMIHLANGWDSSAVSSFYSQVFRPGQLSPSDVDVMGFSFYPFYGTGATLSALQSSLQNIINKYGKDVMVVETDWPAVCSGVTLSNTAVPISAAGQSTWVADIKNVLSALPGGRGLGIVYWEPGWIGNAGLGSSCADNLLVDSSGNTRSSISMFASSIGDNFAMISDNHFIKAFQGGLQPFEVEVMMSGDCPVHEDLVCVPVSARVSRLNRDPLVWLASSSLRSKMPSSLLQILDDNHGEFKYGGAGQWTLSTLVQWYQQTSNYPAFASSSAFGTFSLSFEGTSIAFVGNTPTSAFSQTATVSIDGGAPYNITYSTTPPAYVQWYQSPTLSEGTHTIVVDHLDGTAVDYALIEVGQNTPLNGKTLVIDNDDPSIQFSGKWQRNTDPFDAGSLPDGFPLRNSTHRSSNPGDSYAFGFAGTSIEIYGILNWDNVGTLSATYTLDGQTISQNYPVTTTSPEHVSQDREAINFIYFSQGNLPAGEHTLVVAITECQNSQYIFDYATYTPSFSTLSNMPNISPVSPVAPSSSPSSASSPSQNSPSSPSGSSNTLPTTAGPSNASQSPGTPSGSAGSGSSSGSSGSTNDSPDTNSGSQNGLQNSNGGSVRTSSNKAPIGAIVGGVVGGIVFLILLASLLFMIWKRQSRKASRRMLASEAPENSTAPVRRGFAQPDGAVSPFQDPVSPAPFESNSGSIADLKRQRAYSSTNMRSLGMSTASAAQRSISPETANATSSASMDIEYMQDQGPPAYDDPAHRRNTLRSR